MLRQICEITGVLKTKLGTYLNESLEYYYQFHELDSYIFFCSMHKVDNTIFDDLKSINKKKKVRFCS